MKPVSSWMRFRNSSLFAASLTGLVPTRSTWSMDSSVAVSLQSLSASMVLEMGSLPR